MANELKSRHELKNASYELFILLLSILSIFNLFVLLIPYFDPIIKGVVAVMDIFITVTFMVDFLYRLFSAESKTYYFFRNWGWADLLASMPMQQLKIFRIFRMVRVIQLSRLFGLRNIFDDIIHSRAGSALYMTLFLVLMVLEFGGAGMVYLESSAAEANITTPVDAVWWAFVTISTVGYGDHFPVTNKGRLLGMLVMTLGVGLFGVLTGFLANAFLGARGEEEAGVATADPETPLAEFRRILAEQERMNAAMKVRLAELEALLAERG